MYFEIFEKRNHNICKNVRKCTFGNVLAMKTQISLRIRAVFPESRNFTSLTIQSAHSEYSDQTAQAELNLRKAPMSGGMSSDVAGHICICRWCARSRMEVIWLK